MNKEKGKDVFIYSHSGTRINILDPDPDTIDIKDIAVSLSKLCRFTGHTNVFYSVAEHSIRVANLLPDELKLAGLLHDATEAYLGDVSSPLKSVLPEYKKIEENFWIVIANKFNVPEKLPMMVHDADRFMLHIEWRDLMDSHGNLFPVDDDLGEGINSVRLGTISARRMFMDDFYRYTALKDAVEYGFS